MKEFALYIHIPFCEKKCYYCDFASYSNKFDLVDKYFDYLFREISIYKEKTKGLKLKTIFIGGGTPSSVNEKYIDNLMKHIKENFDTDELIEVTIESNPNSLNKEKLMKYRSCGINRLSIGLQSFNNDLLKKIGRIHSCNDFINSYNLAREVGFENINIDIMFNLPTQTLYDVENSLNEAIKLRPEHISFYSLKLEEGTKFYEKYNDSEEELPNDELEREMYYKGIKLLYENGYYQYEISNFSKVKSECQHNLFYWELKPYLGIGIGAHSNMNKKRWGNYKKINDYFDSLDEGILPIEEEETIDETTEMAEYIILGLRLNKGIDKRNFINIFNKNIYDVYGKELKKFLNSGLLIEDEHYIKLTDKGRDLSNIIFMELLP